MTLEPATPVNLSVQLGRLQLPNPILVASGTFGYAREMEGLFPEVDLDETIEVPSGAIIPSQIAKRSKPRGKRR